MARKSVGSIEKYAAIVRKATASAEVKRRALLACREEPGDVRNASDWRQFCQAERWYLDTLLNVPELLLRFLKHLDQWARLLTTPMSQVPRLLHVEPKGTMKAGELQLLLETLAEAEADELQDELEAVLATCKDPEHLRSVLRVLRLGDPFLPGDGFSSSLRDAAIAVAVEQANTIGPAVVQGVLREVVLVDPRVWTLKTLHYEFAGESERRERQWRALALQEFATLAPTADVAALRAEIGHEAFEALLDEE